MRVWKTAHEGSDCTPAEARPRLTSPWQTSQDLECKQLLDILGADSEAEDASEVKQCAEDRPAVAEALRNDSIKEETQD